MLDTLVGNGKGHLSVPPPWQSTSIGAMPLNTATNNVDLNSLNASPSLQRAEITIKYRKLNPYTTGEINVLLLENISPNAVDIFKRAGFNVRQKVQ